MQPPARKPILAVIGNAGELSPEVAQGAMRIGQLAVDAGFRVACGGRDGVMEAVMKGAHRSSKYQSGDTIGILATYEGGDASPWCDIVIPTGIGYARNMVVVSTGDVVLALGGGAGTLSEIALAWQIQRPVLAWTGPEGWSKKLAGVALDNRQMRVIEGMDEIEPLIARAAEIVRSKNQVSIDLGM